MKTREKQNKGGEVPYSKNSGVLAWFHKAGRKLNSEAKIDKLRIKRDRKQTSHKYLGSFLSFGVSECFVP
jgi:hypothetical protein